MILRHSVSTAIAPFVLLFPRPSSGQTPWLWDGEPWADPRPFMSPITAEIKTHLQAGAAVGESKGCVLGRMGEFGDSITYSFREHHPAGSRPRR